MKNKFKVIARENNTIELQNNCSVFTLNGKSIMSFRVYKTSTFALTIRQHTIFCC